MKVHLKRIGFWTASLLVLLMLAVVLGFLGWALLQTFLAHRAA